MSSPPHSHPGTSWSRWPESQQQQHTSQASQNDSPHPSEQQQQQSSLQHTDYVLQHGHAHGPHSVAHPQSQLLPHPNVNAHAHVHAHSHAQQSLPHPQPQQQQQQQHMYQQMVSPGHAYPSPPSSVVPMHPQSRLNSISYQYSYMAGPPGTAYHSAGPAYATEMHMPIHATPPHLKDDRGQMRLGMDSPTSVGGGAPSPSNVLPHSPLSVTGMTYAMQQPQQQQHQNQMPMHALPSVTSPATVRAPASKTSTSRRRSPRNHSMIEAVPNASSKTVQPNVCLNPEHEAAFNTVVDGLVKAIQEDDPEGLRPSKVQQQVEAQAQVQVQPLQMDSQVQNSIQTQHMMPSPMTAMPSPAPSPSPSRVTKKAGGRSRTRHHCQVPGCDRSFGQKSHLDIHYRAHTGEKPYTCSISGCGRKFSQLGNLRTHERLHSGERPHVCDQCGKAFSARGKLKGHQAIHNGERHFVCKLEDCNKGFTQLGNLKAHQNKFHEGAIRQLTSKFVGMTPAQRANLSSYDIEVLEYFATLYKNSNKGIKGRGKGRKVHIVRPAGSAAAVTIGSGSVGTPTTGSMMMQTQQTPPPQQQQQIGNMMPQQIRMGIAQAPHHGHMVVSTPQQHEQQQMMQPVQQHQPQAMRSYEMRPMMQQRIDSYSTASSHYENHETRSLPDQSMYEDERLRRQHY